MRIPFTLYKKHPTPCVSNAVLGLQMAPEWKGVLRFDRFANKVRVQKAPPRHVVDGGGPDPIPGAVWDSRLTTRAVVWFQQKYGFMIHGWALEAAVAQIARSDSYHPVADYLAALKWDGVRRVDTWLAVHGRVDPSPYSSAVGRHWLVAAVARALEPGCKADNVLVLEGAQRGGKSRLCRALVPDETWFGDSEFRIGSKDGYLAIQGKWIYELAEFTALLKSGNAAGKAFITSQFDTYRAPYERHTESVPRSCVFVATVNEAKYLTDETGGGRFWPVVVRASATNYLDLDPLTRVRDQIWAEAATLYHEGLNWRLLPQDVLPATQEEQDARAPEDAWTEQLEPWLRSDALRGVGVQVSDVLDFLGVPSSQRTKAASVRVSHVLRTLGWEPGSRKREGGARVVRYFPTATLDA